MLSAALAAPVPTYALRPAGVEDPSLKAGIEQALSAGAEEQPTSRRRWTVEKVYVFGGMELTRHLQLYLRGFLIEVAQMDLRLGLKGILLALGVPEDTLRRLDWDSVESALSSLEAA